VQLVRRPLAPCEVDHELVWLTVSLGSLGLAIAWFAAGLPWPYCLFHQLTGLPCLTCGATRSTIEFLHGHFLAAVRWNPLVFSVLCGLSVFNAYALVILISGGPRFRISNLTTREKKFCRVSVLTLLTVNWTYQLVHWRNF
jgi:hypothetical protein